MPETLSLSCIKNTVTVTLGNLLVRMYASGYHKSPLSSLDFHSHPYYEMFFVETGSIEVTTARRVQVFTPDDLYIIPPFLLHTRKNVDPFLGINPYVNISLRFTFHKLKTGYDLYSPFCSVIGDCSHVRSYRGLPFLKKYFMHIEEEAQNPSVFSEIRMVSLVSSIFLAFIERFSANTSEHETAHVKTARDFIIDRYLIINSRKDSLPGSLADSLSLSTRQTARLISSIYSMPLCDRITSLRIDRAKWFLSRSGKKIADIGRACGYRSPSAFREAFKLQTGTTPLKYRKSHRLKA